MSRGIFTLATLLLVTIASCQYQNETKAGNKKQYVLDQHQQAPDIPNMGGNAMAPPVVTSPYGGYTPPRNAAPNGGYIPPPIAAPIGGESNNGYLPPPVSSDEGLQIPSEDENVMDRIVSINDQNGLYDSNVQYDPSSPPKPEYFEGDIVKTQHLSDAVSEMKFMSKNNLRAFDAINGGAWPKAEVPYRFAYGFRGKQVVYNAIAAFKKYTCIRFRPKSYSDRNYVEFMHGGGCSSMIGKQGGRQQISLANGCLVTGIAIHEMMHALGFFHEQSRRDRDTYITINWNNINRGMWYNFQKYRSGHASTLGEPYDKRSVMHYGNYAFSINGRKAIVSKSNRNEVLGQRSGMSTIDKNQLNKYYQCSDTTVPTPSPGGSLTDKYAFCVELTKWCAKDKFVASNCKRTCCRDTKEHCRYWSKGGYCRGKGHDNFMKKYCPQSCGYC